MTNDGAINRLLYAILSQKCLKDIDWNKVAHDPILSQEITNGHAARMRYSRFKKQMDNATSSPVHARKTATPRRSRIEKKKSAKREPKLKNQKDILDSANLPFHLKYESQNAHTPLYMNISDMETNHSNSFPILEVAKREPAIPITPQSKMKTEPDFYISFSTPAESSCLETPFSMNSPTSPNSLNFPIPGIVSFNSSMSSTASLNNRMPKTSFFGPPLHEQTGYKESFGAAYRDEQGYCFDPWAQSISGYDTTSIQDRLHRVSNSPDCSPTI
ncbi:uncharacterized protein Bfra_004274 [Botrytis fragariae]|uniref:Myb-like DNA-binding domain-containing protein n=1 Tax=Botrytis fragariae TaxID=1964551 RepID=A0A8H6AV78_9HELO|nr:uncharacterized protein Bfra_004274 [Botrytis fragariae]KAF5874267.1 hypothetical protein Bfra_004274 [Botrytis fragariae]